MDKSPVETTLYSLDEAPPPTNRRRRDDQRFLSLFRVGALTIDGQRELCLIRNLSAGGMMIRAYSPIRLGSRLSIELKHGEPVCGTVKWVRGETVGVSFDDPIDVLSLLSVPPDDRRPRMPRIQVAATAWVREGANVARVQAINISQGGLQIECASELPLGAEVVVTLSGLTPEPAVVKWKDGNSYGLAFNRVLSIAQLVGWLKAQGERSSALG